MRLCPYCGNPVDDNARFCGNCGADVSDPQAAERDPGSCPNCGGKLPEGSAFCPNCGAAVQSAPAAAPAPAPAPKKPAPRIIGIAVAAAVVIALAAAAVKIVPGLLSSPAKKFIAYQQELFISGLLSGLESGADRFGSGSFSTDLTVTASVDNSGIDYYLADSAVKLGIDLKKDSMVVNGELVLMGSPVLSGTATYDDGRFGFLLPQADNTYYVMDLEKVAKNLFDADLDLDGTGASGISGKQWRSLAEAYLDVVYSTVTDKNVTVEKDRSVRLSGLGGSFTGTVYTFKPTAEDIEDMLIRLADRLERDEDLRGLVLKLSGAGALARLVDDYVYYGYGLYGYTLEEELDKVLLDLAGKLRDEAMWIGRDVEDSGFSWTLAVEGKNVRQIRVSVQNGGSAVVYEAEGAPSDKRTELIYMISYGDRRELAERSYTKKGTEYDGRVTVYGSYGDSVALTYRIDRSKTSVFGIPYGEYRLSVPGGDVSVSMTVAAGGKDSVDHTVTVRTNGSYYDFSRVQVNINATDRGSAVRPSQRAVDISGYSEWELEELFGDLARDLGQKLAGELLYHLPLFGGYGSYGW